MDDTLEKSESHHSLLPEDTAIVKTFDIIDDDQKTAFGLWTALDCKLRNQPVTELWCG